MASSPTRSSTGARRSPTRWDCATAASTIGRRRSAAAWFPTLPPTPGGVGRRLAWRRGSAVGESPGAVLLGVIALVGLAVARHADPWLAAALGVIVIPFAVELTSYYYAFLIVPALFWACWRWSGPLLLALCAFTQFVSLAPLPGMSTWRDEQYTWISLATLIVLSILLVRFASGPTPRDGAETAPPVP